MADLLTVQFQELYVKSVDSVNTVNAGYSGYSGIGEQGTGKIGIMSYNAGFPRCANVYMTNSPDEFLQEAWETTTEC